MSSIGGVTTDIIRGIPAALKPRVDTWEVEGLDGVGAQTLGLGDSEFELSLVLYCANNDTANTFKEAIEALQGIDPMTVIDDFGDAYDGVLVKHVDAKNCKKPCIWQGNNNAYRVEIQIQAVST